MTVEVSVVIGFRDWGLRRLDLATKSIVRSFGSIKGEVIISDYGSVDKDGSRNLAERLGVKYVYTTTDGPWSRSRALNAGFAIAEGKLFVSTDADMVFSPRAFEIINAIADRGGESAYFLQCRDLPEGMDDEWIESHSEEWEKMELKSRLRPRWGMGGMMAIPREGFNAIRGFDERLHTYGGEDLDFAQRARRAGFRTHWVEDPEVRMYHMWHPPTIQTVEQTEQGKETVQFNRSIVYNDKTFVRNYLSWVHRSPEVPPLVTVAIATKNRADMISDTIRSILVQSVQDFEIVIVDDGGQDDLKNVLESFNDSRIRYYWKDSEGISAARNYALDLSEGIYTAVIDDDDLMHPKRLEWHFEALFEGMDGNVGSFVNFDDVSGEMNLHVSMIPKRSTAVEKGSAPGHGTWLVKTDVLRKFRYDETITSGVDNNIMLRMLRAGINLGHTGKPVTLRRMHSRQVTVIDNSRQLGAASKSLQFFRWRIEKYYLKKLEEEKAARGAYPRALSREEMVSIVTPFLPDHLISRNIVISESLQRENISWDGRLEYFVVDVEGHGLSHFGCIYDASYEDLVRARQAGLSFETYVSEDVLEKSTVRINWIEAAIELLLNGTDTADQWVIFVPSAPIEGIPSWSVSVETASSTDNWSSIVTSDDEMVKRLFATYENAIAIGPRFVGMEK